MSNETLDKLLKWAPLVICALLLASCVTRCSVSIHVINHKEQSS